MIHSTIELKKDRPNDPDMITIQEFKNIIIEDFEQFIIGYQKLNSDQFRDLEDWAELYSNWLENN